jgi:hypothetical protein
MAFLVKPQQISKVIGRPLTGKTRIISALVQIQIILEKKSSDKNYRNVSWFTADRKV